MKMVKPDNWIIQQCEENGMITPYAKKSIKKMDVDGTGQFNIVSKGLSSYGYDLSLSPEQFYIAQTQPIRGLVDVKKVKETPIFTQVSLQDYTYSGDFFVIPPLTVALGLIKERVKMPPNVIGIPFGKSTYARIGLQVNMTPFEPSWQGQPTVQMFNALHHPVKVYADEGIAQLLFLEGDTCDVTYADRDGKYQGEGNQVTFSKV